MGSVNITGIILAGGRSSRMGTDKSLLPFRGSTMIEHILSVIASVVPISIIVSNNPASYAHLAARVTPDIFPGRGPLSGIHAGLKVSATDLNLVLSCDIPLVEAGFLKALVAQARSGAYDIIIPQTSDGRQHPLCAVYSNHCLPIIEQCLMEGRFKLDEVYLNPTLKTKVVTQKDFFFADTLLTNVNTQPDYKALKQ